MTQGSPKSRQKSGSDAACQKPNGDSIRAVHKKTTRWVVFIMVGRAGFEPATNWLKAN